VIVPHRWKHYGTWREPKIDEDLTANVRAERVRFPWVGPAQFYLHWYPGLREILADFRPNVIDLWEEPWGAVSAHAVRVNRLMPNPARVICETEQNIDKKLPWPFESWRTFTLKHTDHLIGRSQEAIDVARRKGFIGPATVVPNGVNVHAFRPLTERDSIRAALNLSGFVVCYIGRFVEEKGVLDLIDATSMCGDLVNVVFIGSGPLASAITSRAAACHISNRVRIVPQQQDPAELARWMNAMDVLALPSHTTRRWKEQFGRVIAEAGACGRPVIGTQSGAIPDVVGDGGIIVPERNPVALARAIDDLASNQDLRKLLGHNGYDTATSNFRWEAVARRMYDIYTTVRDLDEANA
jgi:glycosyltransferase involved in cell wall biosynthesis